MILPTCDVHLPLVVTEIVVISGMRHYNNCLLVPVHEVSILNMATLPMVVYLLMTQIMMISHLVLGRRNGCSYRFIDIDCGKIKMGHKSRCMWHVLDVLDVFFVSLVGP